MIGVNVDAFGLVNPLDLGLTGTDIVRFVIPPIDRDLRWWVDCLVDEDVVSLGIVGSETIGLDPEKWEEKLVPIALRYDGTLDIVVMGNEPDGKGPSSWKLTKAEYQRLLDLGRKYFKTSKLCMASLVSGTTAMLDGLDASGYTYGAYNPYGKNPYPDWPSEDWGTGPLIPLHTLYIDAYKKLGIEQLIIGEFGIEILSESEQADYYGRMISCVQRLDGLYAALVFCWTDAMVPGFGMIRTDGTLKPSMEAYYSRLGGAKPEQYKYVEGFEQWHNIEPNLIGYPLENEHGGIHHFSQQKTSYGLLTWADVNGVGPVFTFYDEESLIRHRWIYGESHSVVV